MVNCNLPTNCLSVFDHFVVLALKGLKGGMGFSLTLVLIKINNSILHFKIVNFQIKQFIILVNFSCNYELI